MKPPSVSTGLSGQGGPGSDLSSFTSWAVLDPLPLSVPVYKGGIVKVSPFTSEVPEKFTERV